MTDDLSFELQIFDQDTGTRVREDWTNEHLIDPSDDAEVFVLLDGQESFLAVCKGCGLVGCETYCTVCRCCPCDCGPPFSQREYKAMAARYDAGPTRYRP